MNGKEKRKATKKREGERKISRSERGRESKPWRLRGRNKFRSKKRKRNEEESRLLRLRKSCLGINRSFFLINLYVLDCNF
ncbi:hypothetical protein C1H46_045552 [Malus baccata]|uniref:Uncharacterized protein n=1 Tax=Malus baccata TaxID=106549 RepID=A0A540K3X5_MALBA|nr:hypothetical protein C1H46_045552 [Malus baccata]